MARKQDWSPRGITVPVCQVTLTYDRLPPEWPEAKPLMDILVQETDPEYQVEVYGMPPSKARREAMRMKSIVDAYNREDWWYVQISTSTSIPDVDSNRDFMRLVTTKGEIFSSDFPPNGILQVEQAALIELREALDEIGCTCRRFMVTRLGAFSLQHPDAPRSERAFPVDPTTGRRVGGR